ncbi:hypothetical protein H920_19478 [Fukomys damarensis]|uniref:Uncharacterized protein n=1 Tax=Fukomys damarensis TaxID=885580 RepID=A0A091CKJ7_FUKDA|nr:hypothetical protein H920_19478 [Fukomys damarensis]
MPACVILTSQAPLLCRREPPSPADSPPEFMQGMKNPEIMACDISPFLKITRAQEEPVNHPGRKVVEAEKSEKNFEDSMGTNFGDSWYFQALVSGPFTYAPASFDGIHVPTQQTDSQATGSPKSVQEMLALHLLHSESRNYRYHHLNPNVKEESTFSGPSGGPKLG